MHCLTLVYQHLTTTADGERNETSQMLFGFLCRPVRRLSIILSEGASSEQQRVHSPSNSQPSWNPENREKQYASYRLPKLKNHGTGHRSSTFTRSHLPGEKSCYGLICLSGSAISETVTARSNPKAKRYEPGKQVREQLQVTYSSCV